MHLHVLIDHVCDLRRRGTGSFLRGAIPFALWRDLTNEVVSFGDFPSQQAAQALGVPLAAKAGRTSLGLDSSGDDHLEGIVLTLPRMARRDKDPVSGRTSAAQVLARARKAVGKGQACPTCPVAAVNPDRFGCWVPLVLPVDADTSSWILDLWKRGVQRQGGSRLAPLIRSSPEAAGLYRALLTPEDRAHEHALLRRRTVVLGDRFESLNLEGLFGWMMSQMWLEPSHMVAILEDFDAISSEDATNLRQHWCEGDVARAGRSDSPAPLGQPPKMESAPFLAQPPETAQPGQLAWLSFLHQCYWACWSGRRLQLVRSFLDHDPFAGAAPVAAPSTGEMAEAEAEA